MSQSVGIFVIISIFPFPVYQAKTLFTTNRRSAFVQDDHVLPSVFSRKSMLLELQRNVADFKPNEVNLRRNPVPLKAYTYYKFGKKYYFTRSPEESDLKVNVSEEDSDHDDDRSDRLSQSIIADDFEPYNTPKAPPRRISDVKNDFEWNNYDPKGHNRLKTTKRLYFYTNYTRIPRSQKHRWEWDPVPVENYLERRSNLYPKARYFLDDNVEFISTPKLNYNPNEKYQVNFGNANINSIELKKASPPVVTYIRNEDSGPRRFKTYVDFGMNPTKLPFHVITNREIRGPYKSRASKRVISTNKIHDIRNGITKPSQAYSQDIIEDNLILDNHGSRGLYQVFITNDINYDTDFTMVNIADNYFSSTEPEKANSNSKVKITKQYDQVNTNNMYSDYVHNQYRPRKLNREFITNNVRSGRNGSFHRYITAIKEGDLLYNDYKLRSTRKFTAIVDTSNSRTIKVPHKLINKFEEYDLVHKGNNVLNDVSAVKLNRADAYDYVDFRSNFTVKPFHVTTNIKDIYYKSNGSDSVFIPIDDDDDDGHDEYNASKSDCDVYDSALTKTSQAPDNMYYDAEYENQRNESTNIVSEIDDSEIAKTFTASEVRSRTRPMHSVIENYENNEALPANTLIGCKHKRARSTPITRTRRVSTKNFTQFIPASRMRMIFLTTQKHLTADATYTYTTPESKTTPTTIAPEFKTTPTTTAPESKRTPTSTASESNTTISTGSRLVENLTTESSDFNESHPKTYSAMDIYGMEPVTRARGPGRVWSCYDCGLNDTQYGTTVCYRIFESADQREFYTRRRYRKTCSGDERYSGQCFHRYLDVGITYNERGCRDWPPVQGSTYASKMLMKLEYLLKDVTDGCVVSPHAVLVHFSKSVQLYVRLHVCVCSGDLCNTAASCESDWRFVGSLAFVYLLTLYLSGMYFLNLSSDAIV